MKTAMKILTMILALALVLSLAACGEEKLETPTEAPTTEQPVPEGESVAPEAETAAPEVETTAPAEEATDPTTETTAPAQQEEISFDAEVSLEEELIEEEIPEEDFGVGPLITVKYEVYEAMSDSEKEAYRDCFTTPAAFDFWEENAFMNYENEILDEGFLGAGTLNLKDIYEMLTGKYSA